MDATEQRAAWDEFLRGNPKTFGEPFRNPWAELARDLLRSWGVRAAWIPRHHAVRSRAFPGAKSIECPLPVDAPTWAICIHELMHCAHEEEWKDLPGWVVEIRA